MLKLVNLTVDHLKKELAQRCLPTVGGKAELQQRLLDALEKDGIDTDIHEFVVEVPETSGNTAPVDLEQVTAMMQNLFQEQKQQMQESLGSVRESLG